MAAASPTRWSSPDLLILDEPTTSIDPLGVIEILDLLRGRGWSGDHISRLLGQVQSCDRIGIFAARRDRRGNGGPAGRAVGDGTQSRWASSCQTQADVDHGTPRHGLWDLAGPCRQLDVLIAAVDQGLRLTAVRSR